MKTPFFARLPVLLLTGCATIVSGPSQQVSITSDPPGATVQIREQTLTTPGTATLKRKEDYTVRVTKDGYYENVAILRHRESDWIVGNLLWDLPTTGLLMFLTQGQGGLIVFGPGSICDRATGAGYRLVPDQVELILEKRAAGKENRRANVDREPRIIEVIELPASTDSLQAAAGSLWVVHRDGGFLTSTSSLYRIDPRTNDVVEAISIPRDNGQLLIDNGSVWSTTYEGFNKSYLYKFDLSTNQIVAKLLLPTSHPRLATGEGMIWITGARMEKKGLGLITKGLEVIKVNARTAEISGQILLDETVWGDGPDRGTYSSDITVGPSEVWVSNGSSQKVARINSENFQLMATVSVNQHVQKVMAANDAVWVLGHALEPKNEPPAQVTRIDRLTNKADRPIFAGGVTPGRAAEPPTHAVVGLGAIWLVNGEDGTLQWLDDSKEDTGKALFLGADFKQKSYPTAQVIVAESSVWAAVGKQLLRIAPE